MLQFKYPGVYTQEVSSGVRNISGAPTSVALFVGPTKAGIDGRPTRIFNFGDYERSFGGLDQKSSLSYSVLHFFANGGGEALVIRVPVKNSARASLSLKQDNTGATESLKIGALSSGAGGNEIYVEVDPFGIDAPFATTGGTHDRTRFNLSVIDQITGRAERFGDVTTVAASSRAAGAVVGDAASGSKLISLSVTGIGVEGPQPTGTIYPLTTPLPAVTKDVKVEVVVTWLDNAGAPATPLVIPVTVFPIAAGLPATPLELITRLASAINSKIRGDPATSAAMEGVAIDVELFEKGAQFRLRTALPAGATTKRLSDATVTIKDPTAANLGTTAVGFVASYSGTALVANPSRYRLGATYANTSQVNASAPGTVGDAAGQPDTDVFKQAVLELETPDPFFNILCLPDLVRPATSDPKALHHGAAAMSIYGEAARICKKKFAFLLVDPFPSTTDVVAAEAWKSSAFTFQSSHAAAYFPNIRVDDPLVSGAIRSHPPSGAIAGVYARTDGNFGVWQAPAGTEASLTGVYGPAVELSDDQHGVLNPLGLNVIRRFPIYGTVSFGARTVDGSNAMASEWKYIPVRRTALYILRSLSEGLRWAVHKPNGDTLWAELRMNVTAFMQGLFRQGAFKGTSPRDAFFVLCDASTTTAKDMDDGIVNIVIGFAPLKPAEFVVITLKQIAKPAV